MRLQTVVWPLVALIVVSPAASAGDAPDVKAKNELVAIRDAALADDYAYRQVAHLTDNIGPRPSGSPQAEGAVEYVAGELRQLGLEVRLEQVRVRRWMRGTETAELTEYPGQVPTTTQK